jgi:hypothetical protein
MTTPHWKEASMSDEKPEVTSEADDEQSKTSQAKDKAKSIAGTAGEKIKSVATSPEFRSIRPLTWAGLALGAVYFIGMFIDTVNIRWWIMLPLGIASFLILWKQWKSTPSENGLELKLTFFGLVAILGFLMIRDAWLSSSMADIYEKAKESGETIRELEKLIGH